MLICNGCNGFVGDGDETAAEFVRATLSADPCKAWNEILTFVLGNRSVHLTNKHIQNMLIFPARPLTTHLNW